MPFTPFHFGPGALVKTAFPGRFSLTVFIWTQIFIDLESYYFLAQNAYPVHRFLHSYLGVNLAVAAGIFVGRPMCEFVFRMKISRPAAIAGAAVGGFSHVFFDGLMHADARPLQPFSEANPMLGAVPLGLLHWACAGAGVAALAVYAARLRKAGLTKRGSESKLRK